MRKSRGILFFAFGMKFIGGRGTRPYCDVMSASMDRDARDMRDERDVVGLVDSPLHASDDHTL